MIWTEVAPFKFWLLLFKEEEGQDKPSKVEFTDLYQSCSSNNYSLIVE